jgi:hypothetical protein
VNDPGLGNFTMVYPGIEDVSITAPGEAVIVTGTDGISENPVTLLLLLRNLRVTFSAVE